MKAHKTVEGQLRPLTERLTAHQLECREERRQWRSGLARSLGVAHGTAYAAAAVLRRGFFGRLKWLVLGR